MSVIGAIGKFIASLFRRRVVRDAAAAIVEEAVVEVADQVFKPKPKPAPAPPPRRLTRSEPPKGGAQ